ncbi:MAG: TlpA disulfide reductase family protein [Candidatus Sulfopaludibacter sp.]|nr:TlpA disulfide reductase family protein [Candidatus Sulfopaludibacter sp.]
MPFRQNEILAAGSRAPAIEGLAASGPVLVVFFKITCPVCQFTLPFLNRIQQAGTLPVFGISQNGAADTREFVEEFSVEYPVLLDPEDANFPAGNAYGISTVPSLFLIGQDGKIERAIEGWSRKEMEWLGARSGATVIRQGENVPEWKAG